MYFDQYFIKPAFATLTSLLRTYSALTSRLPFYISSGFGFSRSFLSSLQFSSVSIFFVRLLRHPPLQLFYPSFRLGVQR